jgi:hypothetical protein
MQELAGSRREKEEREKEEVRKTMMVPMTM